MNDQNDARTEELRAKLRAACRDLIGSASHLDGLITHSRHLPAVAAFEAQNRLTAMGDELHALIGAAERFPGALPPVRRRRFTEERPAVPVAAAVESEDGEGGDGGEDGDGKGDAWEGD